MSRDLKIVLVAGLLMFCAGVLIAYYSTGRMTGGGNVTMNDGVAFSGVELDGLKASRHEISRMNDAMQKNDDIIYEIQVRITVEKHGADPADPDTELAWRMRTTTVDGWEIVDKDDCERQRLFRMLARVINVQSERYRTLKEHPDMKDKNIGRML